jgi:hypothetical protein
MMMMTMTPTTTTIGPKNLRSCPALHRTERYCDGTARTKKASARRHCVETKHNSPAGGGEKAKAGAGAGVGVLSFFMAQCDQVVLYYCKSLQQLSTMTINLKPTAFL